MHQEVGGCERTRSYRTWSLPRIAGSDIDTLPYCAIHRSLCGASGELRNPRIPSVVYGESGDVVYVLAKVNLIVLCTLIHVEVIMLGWKYS